MPAHKQGATASERYAFSEPLSEYDLRRLSLAAMVDCRTLKKALAGGRMQPLVLMRIRQAFREAGLERIAPAAGSR